MEKSKKRILILQIVLASIGGLLLLNAIILYFIPIRGHGLYVQFIVSIGLIAFGVFFPRIPNIARIIIAVPMVLFAVFVMFLFTYGNISTTDHTEDVIIVLGAGIIGESVTRPLAFRLDTAIEHWEQNPDALIVVTGGLGDRATITEAEAMARYLIRAGVPAEQIILEDRSTSTYENFKFAIEILEYYFPDGFSVVVITNDFHIFRAVQIARSAGLEEVSRAGAYTDWYTWGINYFREFLAILNFWGRSMFG